MRDFVQRVDGASEPRFMPVVHVHKIRARGSKGHSAKVGLEARREQMHADSAVAQARYVSRQRQRLLRPSEERCCVHCARVIAPGQEVRRQESCKLQVGGHDRALVADRTHSCIEYSVTT